MMESIGPTVKNIVHDFTDESTKELQNFILNKWDVEREVKKVEIADFQYEIGHYWGSAIDFLQLLLICCREIGQITYRRHVKSSSKRFAYRRWVLVRLQARACQVTDEIICLLANGFADGAMARWRTLHELAVVAALIADGDEDLAERYINHDAVEVKKQADEYHATQVPFGFRPIAKADQGLIDQRYDEVIKRYGQSFMHPYGWASKHLKMKKPTFKDLQGAADHIDMSGYYKIASFNVHAGARSLFFNLSAMSLSDTIISGRSNAGLREPGERAAHALLYVTSLFVGPIGQNINRLIEMKTLVMIRDKTIASFAKAESQMIKDHRILLNKGNRGRRNQKRNQRSASRSRTGK